MTIELWRLTVIFVFSMSTTVGIGMVALHVFNDDTTCTSMTIDDYKNSAVYNPAVSLDQNIHKCLTLLHSASSLITNFLVYGVGFGIFLYCLVIINHFRKDKETTTSEKRFGAV